MRKSNSCILLMINVFSDYLSTMLKRISRFCRRLRFVPFSFRARFAMVVSVITLVTFVECFYGRQWVEGLAMIYRALVSGAAISDQYRFGYGSMVVLVFVFNFSMIWVLGKLLLAWVPKPRSLPWKALIVPFFQSRTGK